ncbi:STAS domain-containing protein [Streptomyces pactum]|uniref:STAS domain-containing protein n=1 Tax=Streptomyces pactum TaxID=68249 RepID=A0ABS0NLL0_9ACTN|nr:STAS domain-containing protein [Streptomyces pactum]MBH5336080.1 STAS domain-containing protein [Streptomyces pactum]
MAAVPTPSAPRSERVVLVLRSPLGPGDVAGLCARLRELLEGEPPAGRPGRGSGSGDGGGGGGGYGGGDGGRSAGAARDAGEPPVICDVAGLTGPGLAAMDALARLQLIARRHGRRLRLRRAAPPLRELIALAGLGDVLPCLDEPGPAPHHRRH